VQPRGGITLQVRVECVGSAAGLNEILQELRQQRLDLRGLDFQPHDHLAVAVPIRWCKGASSVQRVAEKLPQKLLLPVHFLGKLRKVREHHLLAAFTNKNGDRQLEPLGYRHGTRGGAGGGAGAGYVLLELQAVEQGEVVVAPEVLGVNFRVS